MASAIDALGVNELFEESWELCIHHYLASVEAVTAIEGRLEKANRDGIFREYRAQHIHPSYGMVLPCDLPITESNDRVDDFVELTNKYYDPVIRTTHTDVGGVYHLGLGYGGCALPLVLEHNTPNNSVALLWAETSGGNRSGDQVLAMRPLFRRRERHV